jgi:dipeptidase E
MTRTVIAAGDGLLNGDNPLADFYILAKSGITRPKICLLPTASGDNKGIVNYFMSIFEKYPCKPSYLTLFDPHTADIENFILSQNIIYITGGQSKSMLGVWKEWGVDKILRKAYENGTIMAGGSAGSVCWFNQCITDSIPGTLSVMDALNFLPFSNCPHYLSQLRRSAYRRLLLEKRIMNGYAADDFAMLHFENEALIKCVSNTPFSKCWKVGIDNDVLSQERLKTYWLGLDEYQEELIWSSKTFSS